MSVRGMDGATAAAQLGHAYVATPTSHCYLDNPLSVISLEKAYSFEPIPERLTAAQAAHCLGVQGNLWAEHSPRRPTLTARSWPRLARWPRSAGLPRKVPQWPRLSRPHGIASDADGRPHHDGRNFRREPLERHDPTLAAMAEFPDPPYTTRQFSSYDRASTTPADSKTWFANNDSAITCGSKTARAARNT